MHVNNLDSWHYLNVFEHQKCSGSAAPTAEYINGPLREPSSGRAMLRALLPSISRGLNKVALTVHSILMSVFVTL